MQLLIQMDWWLGVRGVLRLHSQLKWQNSQWRQRCLRWTTGSFTMETMTVTNSHSWLKSQRLHVSMYSKWFDVHAKVTSSWWMATSNRSPCPANQVTSTILVQTSFHYYSLLANSGKKSEIKPWKNNFICVLHLLNIPNTSLDKILKKSCFRQNKYFPEGKMKWTSGKSTQFTYFPKA